MFRSPHDAIRKTTKNSNQFIVHVHATKVSAVQNLPSCRYLVVVLQPEVSKARILSLAYVEAFLESARSDRDEHARAAVGKEDSGKRRDVTMIYDSSPPVSMQERGNGTAIVGLPG